eukprot:TRINITY_DN27016_c1_g1_i3.p2 TRINITY_DN27016_c1_g1~~TRINITY_DN27016_c1_g1_i3.p2  ORF type:complete len:156 (+),score=34.96 TRINITY_DN27016_c1_g1_i3:63-530(+)
MQGARQLLTDLPPVGKVLLGNGLLDVLFPNPMTAAPLLRVLDAHHRSKKKRGWAWLFIMCGLMKVRSAFADEPMALHIAGTAYLWQAIAMATEGFYHRSIPRPTKVLGSTIGFCLAMLAWLQVRAWRSTRCLADDHTEQTHAQGALPSAPPLAKA